MSKKEDKQESKDRKYIAEVLIFSVSMVVIYALYVAHEIFGKLS